MVRCHGCGTSTTATRQGRPWCPRCRTWLQLHEPSGQWVSPAAHRHRTQRARDATAIAGTRRQALEGVEPAGTLLPTGWTATVEQGPRGASWTLAIRPPAGPVDATAYLTPPHSGHGWHVQIHNRSGRVSFPLYAPGGAHAATYPTLAAALTAAVTAVGIEIASATAGG